MRGMRLVPASSSMHICSQPGFHFFFLPTQSASYAHGITAFVEHFINCSLAPKTLLIFITLTTVVPVRSRSQNRPLLRLQFSKSLWTSKSSPEPQKHTSDQSPLFLLVLVADQMTSVIAKVDRLLGYTLATSH